MRIFGGLVLAIAFVIWLLYRLYKKDLRQNMQALYVYLSFVVVWAVIYGFMFS
jgi:hypothetical protein